MIIKFSLLNVFAGSGSSILLAKTKTKENNVKQFSVVVASIIRTTPENIKSALRKRKKKKKTVNVQRSKNQ